MYLRFTIDGGFSLSPGKFHQTTGPIKVGDGCFNCRSTGHRLGHETVNLDLYRSLFEVDRLKA